MSTNKFFGAAGNFVRTFSAYGAAPLTITPAKNILGAIRLPGDKSVSHRYAMLAAIAQGKTRLGNFSSGADCASTLSSLRQLGSKIEPGSDGTIEIQGQERLQAPAESLDCGNSGSTMRMLSGILAGHDFESRLRGDHSLSRRPMGRVMAPLRQMGAEVHGAQDDRPPLQIRGGHL
jgi:3-phosphoshikimate 1-carboxyvinyltransferase